jgi:prolyl 4-hydroxylase
MKALLLPLVAAALLSVFVQAQVCTKDGSKCDTHERCQAWKDDGECVRSKSYMKKHCPASCEGVRKEVKEAGLAVDAGNCKDMHEHCPLWAQLGECEETDDMIKYCGVSCRACEPDENESGCKDEHENCAFWQSHGECEKNPAYMNKHCPVSCNTCEQVAVVGDATESDDGHAEMQRASAKFGTMQTIKGSRSTDTAVRLAESIAYMTSDVVLELSDKIRTNCHNRNELCTFWAVIGECEKNAAYMKTNCAPACQTCHLIDIEKRCPKLGDDVDPALHPGDLNKMFERILRLAPGNRTDSLTEVEREELTASQTPLYTVHVHSRPESVTEISAALDKSMPPWVITFDNFITAEECEALIALGYKEGYARSADVGGQKFDGTVEAVQSERRTSENAWCSDQKGCRQQDVPTRIHNRMASVMGIPAENSEDLQLLRYEVGQF